MVSGRGEPATGLSINALFTGLAGWGKTPIRARLGKGPTSVVPLSPKQCVRALAPEVCFSRGQRVFRNLLERASISPSQRTAIPTPPAARARIHLAWGCEDAETNWPGAGAFQNGLLLAVAGRGFDSRRTCHSEWADQNRGLRPRAIAHFGKRSEEHTSELQSHLNLVCRLLLENKSM